MEQTQKTILIGGAILVLILFLALIFIPKEQDAPVGSIEVEDVTDTASTSGIIINEEGVIAVEGGTVDIIEVEQPVSISAPDFNRPITIPDYYPKDAAQIVATKIADAIIALEKDSESFENWLTLGNLRNQTEDYEGAAEIYEYLTKTKSDSSIPYTNLGNIYHYHLKNFPKAEENYKTAIEKSPENESAYVELHALYKNVYKTETTLAEDTLLSGLVQKPNSINFMLLLGTYYKDKGDTSNQLLYLNKALNEANRINNTELVGRINTEISDIDDSI